MSDLDKARDDLCRAAERFADADSSGDDERIAKADVDAYFAMLAYARAKKETT